MLLFHLCYMFHMDGRVWHCLLLFKYFLYFSLHYSFPRGFFFWSMLKSIFAMSFYFYIFFPTGFCYLFQGFKTCAISIHSNSIMKKKLANKRCFFLSLFFATFKPFIWNIHDKMCASWIELSFKSLKYFDNEFSPVSMSVLYITDCYVLLTTFMCT